MIGTGWRNVAVGALPAFRGVKCCCNVLNAGRVTFLGSSLAGSLGFVCRGTGSSGFVAALGRKPPLVTSGLVFTLADRLRPARRVDVLVIAGSGCIELVSAWAAAPEEM